MGGHESGPTGGSSIGLRYGSRTVTRVLVFTALFSVLAVLVAGCDDGGDSSYSWGGPPEACRQYQSCGSCTPIVGCGWCTGPNGDGVCASDPDFCPTQEFSWTWDSTGCRTLADASVVGAVDGALSAGDAGTLLGDSESSDSTDAELASQPDVLDGEAKTSRDAAGSSPCSASSSDASDASSAPCD